MTAVKTYPYQILDLADLEGEKWDDLPHFDGEYLISNYGRIKSLRRWRQFGTGGTYTKDKILKADVHCRFNKHLKANTYHLAISIYKGGRYHKLLIARMVYYVFVASFDLDNKDLLISYKDFDGKNLKADNLILSNHSKVTSRSFEFKRTECTVKKAVVQISMEGKVLARFDSMHEAGRKTGSDAKGILDCVNGVCYQSNGFRWELEEKKDERIIEKEKVLFHEGLWERLGLPQTARKRPLPVLNLNLETMAGEIWKPLIGYANLYQISNKGRIKICGHFDSRRSWVQEKIAKLIWDGNKGKRKPVLRVSLTKEGKKMMASVARLVYHHFVEPFEINNQKYRIAFKDGCYYNLSADNLSINVSI